MKLPRKENILRMKKKKTNNRNRHHQVTLRGRRLFIEQKLIHLMLFFSTNAIFEQEITKKVCAILMKTQIIAVFVCGYLRDSLISAFFPNKLRKKKKHMKCELKNENIDKKKSNLT